MSQQIDFMAPRLVGERFTGHAIPLEVLKDLAVLEEMVVEVAKWKYRQEHPGRKRIPRGFTEDISITLTGIDDGSAIPKLVLVIGALTLLPPENQNYFEKARDAIIGCIDAAEFDETKITQFLPGSYLSYFDRMGRSLRDNEAIEFKPQDRQRPARLNKPTRRKLLEISSIKEWTEETVERGYIPEMDQDKMKCTLQLLNGHKLQVPIESQHKETILEAFIGFDQKVRVIIHGIGRYDKMQRLESLDIPIRLIELSFLKDGWLDGKGKAPDKKGLEWLTSVFDMNYGSDLPLPYLYPTPEGGIQAEWTLNSWEVSLEIDLAAQRAEFQAVHTAGGETIDKEYNLADKNEWTALNETIDNLQKEQA